ncbi:MAG: hypothetical protein JWR80_9350 [Bradyrhizobium sp.]|nr:hypothetical protein [Bradyrhizobium sp.]
MSSAAPLSTKIDTVKEYFRRSDLGDFPTELFTRDFEFFFPKFGVGHGLDEFYELAIGMSQAGAKITHHQDRLRFIEGDRHVVVEGTTYGNGLDGGSWSGGETPGGRFCSVFAFTDDGLLIERMYIYLDPDYTSADKPRFRWKRILPRW